MSDTGPSDRDQGFGPAEASPTPSDQPAAPPAGETFGTPGPGNGPTGPALPQHPGPGQHPDRPPAGYTQLPLDPGQERTWGMLTHISALVAWLVTAGTLSFLGPLVVYVMYKDRSVFVREHATEALNFQLSLYIYTAVGILLSIITLGLGLIIVLPVAVLGAIAAIIFMIIGTVAASDGRPFRYPLTIRLVK